MGWVVPTAIVVAILVALGWRTGVVMRSERGQRRGAAPGQGRHVLRSEYFSGGGGGGEARDYTVPKDPQDYARLFVPKDKHGR